MLTFTFVLARLNRLSELLELRRLRKARQGIDAHKLSSGDAKKKRRRHAEEAPEDKGGLRPGASGGAKIEDDSEQVDTAARARRAVRTNNFTQQTNALDVDKHMMAYIEENLMIRRQERDASEKSTRDAKDDFALSERWKTEKKTADEGSVTNSMAMLTAIPEVDLGMDSRLRNIEETEKAKRQAAEERKERKKVNTEEEHLVATRFYRPHLKSKSDAEIMRDAKLEAMGLPPREDRKPRYDKPQMATDEMVMERFKKRMRR
ncbi:hepatocellular carcinoma-associated antigen 59-domain-containing protein [Boletus edulis BED1]|uniref:Hepatocellular carcinoma-associated antigen 59-domain-containing protein n=1 Tax=Boletus edulis BED1 TaxID=1328754 RepID=A0AAD4BQS1_BOLED|nr:hepatocellular carcinoma-associated antigen 59-domain-containing protein [Boletus edulis BED1]